MLYNIFSGTGDYKHVMFTTSDKAAADAFVADFNRQFNIQFDSNDNDFDTYLLLISNNFNNNIIYEFLSSII